VQGAVTNWRQTVIQAMVIDYTAEPYHDAAFSLYYTTALSAAPPGTWPWAS
jgi:hypothetical protein